VFEEDEGGVEGLDLAVDLYVVGGEQVADGVEIALGEGGPEVLLLGDDFYGFWGGLGLGLGLGLSLGLSLDQGGDREEEEEAAHWDYVSAWLLIWICVRRIWVIFSGFARRIVVNWVLGSVGSGGFRLAFVVGCWMIRLSFERGTLPPWGCGVFCREVFCFDGFGGGVWLQNIDAKGVAAKILHSGGLRERAHVRGGGVWIYFVYFYFSGLEGVGRTRGFACLERGFAVLGLDSIKRRAGATCSSGLSGVAC
jgi:hypothetical protein